MSKYGFVAKNPKDGLFYGIDRVLRCPITDGSATRQDAERALEILQRQAEGDIRNRKACFYGI
jgi:hypothetical protein